MNIYVIIYIGEISLIILVLQQWNRCSRRTGDEPVTGDIQIKLLTWNQI